jgi:hypothetical protein
MWQSLSLKDHRLLEKPDQPNRHELSPELNIYKLAKDTGMRIYDIQPTLVFHASGSSNTWMQKIRPDIGRWTHKWPLATSTRPLCPRKRVNHTVTNIRARPALTSKLRVQSLGVQYSRPCPAYAPTLEFKYGDTRVQMHKNAFEIVKYSACGKRFLRNVRKSRFVVRFGR